MYCPGLLARDELKSTVFSIFFQTSFSFKSGLFYSCSCQYANKACYKPCLHYIKIVRSIYCMLLANWKTIKVHEALYMGKFFNSINDHAPLYNLRQNLQTLQHQKGMTHIQHSNLTSDPFCANVDDIVHKMTISPSILLLITCICNCQFDAGKSISIRCRRYRHQGKTTAR